jgi:iron(III) transport system ATP-binding protein
VIKINAISKTYGRVKALSEVSLEVSSGETVGILGPSGSGKTTLLRIVAGFEYPSSGEVFIDDKLVSAPDYLVEPNRRGISAVFQTPALWPNMTIRENLEYVQPSKPFDELIERIGLKGLIDRYPNELSGGEARRASIARALVAEKSYLLLDEPLVNLNPELKEVLHTVIVEETKKRGMGVLYISHDASELAHADRIYDMGKGRFAEKQ